MNKQSETEFAKNSKTIENQKSANGQKSSKTDSAKPKQKRGRKPYPPGTPKYKQPKPLSEYSREEKKKLLEEYERQQSELAEQKEEPNFMNDDSAEEMERRAERYKPPKMTGFPAGELKKIEQSEEGRAVLAKTIHNVHAFFKIGLNPVKSNDELCDRTNFYFEACEKTQQLPTWEKYCLCVGYSRFDVHRWANGDVTPSWGDKSTCHILQKVKEILGGLDGELAAQGKIQPVVYFFRARNFYNMVDQINYVVTPGTPDQITPQEAKQILDELPEGKPPFEG